MIKNMDRRELRFRILFEYYRLHHERKDYNPSELEYKNLGLNETEILSAENYLIETGHLRGKNEEFGGLRYPIPSIVDIAVKGIDLVEKIMDEVLEEVDIVEDSSSVGTTQKITLFASKCLKNPITEQICIKAFEIIVSFFQINHS